MKSAFPEYLSARGLVEKKLSTIPATGEKGKEVVDMSAWMPPVFVETWAYELATKPHLIPYLVSQKEMAGFFGDLWKGIKSVGEHVWSFTKKNVWLIAPAVAGGVAYAVSKDVRKHPEYVLGPLGVYYLGYALHKWKKKPTEALKKGVTNIKTPSPQAKPKTEVVKKSPILKDLMEMGSEVAAMLISQKIQEWSMKHGQAPQQTMEQGWAYVTRWGPEFAQMGMTPEEALASVFYATGGAPPNPEQDPWELLRIQPFKEAKEKEGIGEFMRKYGWMIALGVAGLVLLKGHGGKA